MVGIAYIILLTVSKLAKKLPVSGDLRVHQRKFDSLTVEITKLGFVV
jgi:hypothetical protein